MFDVMTNVGFEWSKCEEIGKKVGKRGRVVQYKYDFVIEFGKKIGERGVIIEVDGPHHFHDYYPRKSLEEQQRDDVTKMRWAWQRGYKVIRIDCECLCDEDWGQMLLNAISEKNGSCNVIYIGERYESHKFAVEMAELAEVRRRELAEIDRQRVEEMETQLLRYIIGAEAGI
jgi:very-short-patch-repair endonuclease